MLLILALFLPASFARAETLVLATEPYPPFTVVEDGEVTGGGISLVQLIMKDTGQDYRIEVMTWARALALATREPMRCVFAAARTPEREGLFKWVEPLLVVRSFLVTAAGSGVRAATLEEAKRYVVGTHRDDFSEALLRNLGFPRIDIAADFTLSLRKLVNGRIDLMPITEESFAAAEAQGHRLEKVVLLSEERLGIACNPSVPDALIAAMNANLQRLSERGEAWRILEGEGKATGP